MHNTLNKKTTMKVKFDIKRLGEDLSLQRRGLALRTTAKKINIPHATLHRIENGKQRDVHVSTLLKVCNWMDIEPSIYFNPVRK